MAARFREDILEPGLAIIDAHHHFYDRAGWRYLCEDYLTDARTGHAIQASVYMQGLTRYRREGPDPALIVAAVRPVAQGRKYVTPEIAQMLVESLTAPTSEMAHEKLFDRELQTLVMIASGKRLSDIADELTLSPKTVSVYRARVLDKLGLANNSELTVYAIRNGLVGS